MKQHINHWAFVFICLWNGHDLSHPLEEFKNGKFVVTPYYKCHTCGRHILPDK